MAKPWRTVKETSLMNAPPYVDSIEALKDEFEEAPGIGVQEPGEIPHAEPGALQAVKSAIKGHGEQTILPDDCEFGDNDLCYVET